MFVLQLYVCHSILHYMSFNIKCTFTYYSLDTPARRATDMPSIYPLSCAAIKGGSAWCASYNPFSGAWCDTSWSWDLCPCSMCWDPRSSPLPGCQSAGRWGVPNEDALALLNYVRYWSRRGSLALCQWERLTLGHRPQRTFCLRHIRLIKRLQAGPAL